MSVTADRLPLLKEHFDLSEVQFRASTFSERTGKVMVLAYINSRTVQDKLDDVVGQGNWQNEFKPWGEGQLCGISVNVDGQWVTKWDGAATDEVLPSVKNKVTKVDLALKSGLSDAFKRAAVQWGVGRYLYDAPTMWVLANTKDYKGKISLDTYKPFKNPNEPLEIFKKHFYNLNFGGTKLSPGHQANLVDALLKEGHTQAIVPIVYPMATLGDMTDISGQNLTATIRNLEGKNVKEVQALYDLCREMSLKGKKI